MNRVISGFVALGLLYILSGCRTSVLTMSHYKPPINQSEVSPKLKARKITKVMVIPPSGTARGKFDEHIVWFEQEFLKRGITVISGAITGKVVLESPNSTDEKKNESAALLSDLERALIMAKRTGAEAILQVGDLRWSEKMIATRYFITWKAGTPFREISQQEYALTSCRDIFAEKAWSLFRNSGCRVAYPAGELYFVGRFVDVDNGEVIATLNITMPWNYVLPVDYVAKHVHNLFLGWHPEPSDESFNYFEESWYWDKYNIRHERSQSTWQDDAKEKVIGEVIRKAVDTLFPMP